MIGALRVPPVSVSKNRPKRAARPEHAGADDDFYVAEIGGDVKIFILFYGFIPLRHRFQSSRQRPDEKYGDNGREQAQKGAYARNFT